MSYYENIYKYGLILIYGLYAVSILGVWNEAPIYLDNINYFFKLFIAIVLMYFFNPLRKDEPCTPIQKRIVFSAAFFILASTTISAFKTNVVDFYKRVSNLIE